MANPCVKMIPYAWWILAISFWNIHVQSGKKKKKRSIDGQPVHSVYLCGQLSLFFGPVVVLGMGRQAFTQGGDLFMTQGGA